MRSHKLPILPKIAELLKRKRQMDESSYKKSLVKDARAGRFALGLQDLLA